MNGLHYYIPRRKSSLKSFFSFFSFAKFVVLTILAVFVIYLFKFVQVAFFKLSAMLNCYRDLQVLSQLTSTAIAYNITF